MCGIVRKVTEHVATLTECGYKVEENGDNLRIECDGWADAIPSSAEEFRELISQHKLIPYNNNTARGMYTVRLVERRYGKMALAFVANPN